MAMTMKRKRSDSEISFSSSMLSSPQSNAMDIDMCMSPTKYQPFENTPSHLSSRTRKRFRDNRPSEATIHKNTLSLLFSAQKQAHIQPLPNPTTSTNTMSTDSTHQSSLHSFWALPSQNSSTSSTPSPPPVNMRMQTNCEDCDANLFASDDNSMDIDVDMCDASVDFGCSVCGKQVCNPCSISNLDSHRQCLNCAGKRKLVGGSGVKTARQPLAGNFRVYMG